MEQRREFLKQLATGGGTLLLLSQDLRAATGPMDSRKVETGAAQRSYWLSILEKITTPVLEHLARRELRKAMPVETAGSSEKLKKYTHLEAISRLLVGIAPWL